MSRCQKERPLLTVIWCSPGVICTVPGVLPTKAPSISISAPLGLRRDLHGNRRGRRWLCGSRGSSRILHRERLVGEDIHFHTTMEHRILPLDQQNEWSCRPERHANSGGDDAGGEGVAATVSLLWAVAQWDRRTIFCNHAIDGEVELAVAAHPPLLDSKGHASDRSSTLFNDDRVTDPHIIGN